MYAGGGVFDSSCVQEEIRFTISPELLVATLLFERLGPHEAFVVHGTERYSSYTGYGESFKFCGGFTDTTDFEIFANIGTNDMAPYKRRKSVVVGIDAICYFGVACQSEWSHIRREIIKACAGFFYPDQTCLGWKIGTGNWGCGVLGGKPELKFLIQWMSATLAGKDLTYHLCSVFSAWYRLM
uniref:Poly(ADPribose) glycohydrolase putative n=1 Tax=Albugo laibachii Nc14 TaxID=890382 RepID=F0W9L5_9STRA|nr:Poly(ADPribose) glycohydrolase putative [Albugo laibachii Nc14]|eukprot:CCA17833.1 Poly(ADPribose) glycohydrolase putative [Albugo laibachii Nc14]